MTLLKINLHLDEGIDVSNSGNVIGDEGFELGFQIDLLGSVPEHIFNNLPTPLAGGQEKSFAEQMNFFRGWA